MEPNLYLNMKRTCYAIAFCLIAGIYGCSQKDAGTNNNNNNTPAATQDATKDSLLKAADKLNAADSGKGMAKDTAVKDGKPKSH